MRDGIAPLLALGDIEAPELVVQHAGVPDVNLRRTCGQRSRDGQHRGLGRLIEDDACRLRRGAGADGHVPEIDLRRVQHDPVRGSIDPDANRFGPFESLSADVDDERQIVVFGCGRWRQTLGAERRGKKDQDQERYAQGGAQPPKPHEFSVP